MTEQNNQADDVSAIAKAAWDEAWKLAFGDGLSAGHPLGHSSLDCDTEWADSEVVARIAKLAVPASSADRSCDSAEMATSASWWALVDGAAAALEQAANHCGTVDSEAAALGAANHYRERAQALYVADQGADKCFKCGHPAHSDSCVNVAPSALPAALTAFEYQDLALLISSIRGAAKRGEKMTVVESDAELLERVSNLLAAQPAENAPLYEVRSVHGFLAKNRPVRWTDQSAHGYSWSKRDGAENMAQQIRTKGVECEVVPVGAAPARADRQGVALSDVEVFEAVAEVLGQPLIVEDLREGFSVHTEPRDWLKFASLLLARASSSSMGVTLSEPTLFRWKTSWGDWTYRTEKPAGWKNLPCFEAYSLFTPEQERASSSRAEVETMPADIWRELLEAVVRELPGHREREGNAPGHAHSIPGIWDGDNGAKAGKPCAWCIAWNAACNALAAAEAPNGEGK